MGFFSFVGDCVSSVCSGVWAGVKTVAKAVVDGGKWVKEKVSNTWNKFSGKDKFDEANALYEEITQKYERRKQQFEQDLKLYNNLIAEHVETINGAKEKIKTELFVSMGKKLEQIKDIKVLKDFAKEEYVEKNITVESIRSKEALYKIDFDKNKFKTTIEAIVFLGFTTRKKAKETLLAVEEEEKKVDCEIAKMDAETVKLKAIEESLKNVAYYFTSLIELYENLLVRLDSSVNYLIVRCMVFAHKLLDSEMSIRKLPKTQQKEVEAIITASKILKAMTDMQILSVADKKQVGEYSQKMQQEHDSLREVYNAA